MFWWFCVVDIAWNDRLVVVIEYECYISVMGEHKEEQKTAIDKEDCKL